MCRAPHQICPGWILHRAGPPLSGNFYDLKNALSAVHMDSQAEPARPLKLTKLLKNRLPATEGAKRLLGNLGLLSIAYSCSILADKSAGGSITAEDVKSVLGSLKGRQRPADHL